MTTINELQPAFTTIDQEIIRQAITVCETAIESTSECVAIHDSSLGRTTRKNRMIGERYDAEIAEAKMCRDKLRASLGWPALDKSEVTA